MSWCLFPTAHYRKLQGYTCHHLDRQLPLLEQHLVYHHQHQTVYLRWQLLFAVYSVDVFQYPVKCYAFFVVSHVEY